MNKPCFRVSRSSLLLTLSAALTMAGGSAEAQQPRTLSDCRAIQGELARYACYEALEDPAAAATPTATPPAVPVAPAAPAVAAPVTPARPVANLPVVRRPSLDVGDLTGQSAPAATGQASGAVVRAQEAEEKPGFLRRLLPFGGDDTDAEAAEAAEPVAEATPAAPASEVASFGLPGSSARVETNEEGLKELVDVVAAVKPLSQNMIEVTLESGQVWRQMLSKRYPIKVGETVTIRPTRWGSAYRLTSERVSGFIQVQRIK
jgi:hypothetical protein